MVPVAWHPKGLPARLQQGALGLQLWAMLPVGAKDVFPLAVGVRRHS